MIRGRYGSSEPRTAGAMLLAFFTLSSTARAQQPALTVQQVSEIFYSGGDVAGWDEFDVPEFLAAAYGSRAGPALRRILESSSTPENYYLQLEALTAAQYPKVGVPIPLLMEFATGRRQTSLPAEVQGILRQRAIKALSTHPEPSLAGFWRQLQTDPNPMFRQYAPFGLACALGTGALTEVEALTQGPDSVLRRHSERLMLGLVSQGEGATVCGGATRASAADYPDRLRPDLRRRGERLLRSIP